MSLLEYAILLLHETRPGCTALADELAHLREAGKIKLADVRAALQKLTGEARELQVAPARGVSSSKERWASRDGIPHEGRDCPRSSASR